MNKDFRISTNLVNHPKTKMLIRVLGKEGFFSLISLWSYVAINKPTGDITGVSELHIAVAADWEGDEHKFFQSLVDVGFIDCNEDGKTLVHDWAVNNPYACDSEQRSNKARFSKMKFHYPELYEELRKNGIRSISVDDYKQTVNDFQRTVNEPLTKSNEPLTKSNAPSTPVPAPAPEPAPALKESCNDVAPTEEKPNEKENVPALQTDHFSSFWESFGDKRGKAPALKAFGKAIKHTAPEIIIDGAVKYAKEREYILSTGGTPKMAQGWLNDKRWEDEPSQHVLSSQGCKGFKTKIDTNREIQEIGYALAEATNFDPYAILEAGNSGDDVDTDSRALPE